MNLVNEHNFAKLKPSKRHMHVTKQWNCMPIRQKFFAKSFIKSISPPNIIAAKYSHYTVCNFLIMCNCAHNVKMVTSQRTAQLMLHGETISSQIKYV